MAINERDFYASHGIDFDYKNMLDEYIKGVIKQAKIEALTELQTEIEELPMYYDPLDISDLIQQKINELEGKISNE